LAQFKKAKEMLEMGLDYLVDDNALTKLQHTTWWSVSWFRRWKKKDFYFSKANQLLKQ
jgi:hypothetical protein